MPDSLEAISPVDGRYADATAPLRPYASELALQRARLQVEIEYLIALADLAAFDLAFADDDRETVRSWYRSFERTDAERIKGIEVEGDTDRPATNHDVKAVEYYLRDRLDEYGLAEAVPFVHFGLTSEDVNNLAYRLLIRDACQSVILPAIAELATDLRDEADRHRSLPMLSLTHGQPATPTTYGKELAIFEDRLDRGANRLERTLDDCTGKLGGATGTLGAHYVAEPTVDWRAFAASFVEHLGFDYRPLTTQVNPNDDLAAIFDALAGIASIVLDLDRDMWLYISHEYLGQRTTEGEVGSSTMPHKVNPIDFENSEGNLERARVELRFIADYVTTSRLQRDLSDSTVMRSIGTGLGHILLGLNKAQAGLRKVSPNETVLADALDANPAVLGEAVQTALRRVGDRDAYERVKAATRGIDVDMASFADAIERVRADDPELADRLASLTPATYLGDAADLVDRP